MASINQTLCKDHGGLLDLPQEILCMILEACLISHIPIDNPTETVRKCSCNKHSEKWKDCECPRKSARDWRAERTIRDLQGHAHDTKEGKHARYICTHILTTNKLIYRLGSKILYANNTFLFTHEPAFLRFVERFPDALPRIRHIILAVRITKYSSMLSCVGARMADVQEYPHGPWFGFAASVSDWVPPRKAPELESSARRGCPLSSIGSLDSLTLHFLDWQQWEVININGTPYVKEVPYVNSQGERVTDNPAEEDLRLVHQVSRPLRFTQPIDGVELLSRIFSVGWRAKDIRLSGSGEFCQAQEYPAMRVLADHEEQGYAVMKELANGVAAMTVNQST